MKKRLWIVFLNEKYYVIIIKDVMLMNNNEDNKVYDEQKETQNIKKPP